MKVVYLNCRFFFINQCRLKILISDGIFYFLSNTISVWLDCFQTA